MRNIFLTLLCCTTICKTHGQTRANFYTGIIVEITKEKKPKKMYSSVQILQPFPGGDSVWIKALEKRLDNTLKYKNGAKPGKYIVEVRFIVTMDGHWADMVCLTKQEYGMCNEVITAIKKSLQPVRWAPAQQVRPLRVTTVNDKE